MACRLKGGAFRNRLSSQREDEGLRRKKHKPQVLVSQGQSAEGGARDRRDPAYLHRRRKEFGGLKTDQAERLKFSSRPRNLKRVKERLIRAGGEFVPSPFTRPRLQRPATKRTRYDVHWLGGSGAGILYLPDHPSGGWRSRPPQGRLSPRMAKAIAGQPVVIGDVPNPCVRDHRIVLPDSLDFRGVDRPVRRRLPQAPTSTSPAISRNRQPWSDREGQQRIQDHQPAC